MRGAVVAAICALGFGAGAYFVIAPNVSGMVRIAAGDATLGYVYYTGLYGPMPYAVEGFWIDKFEVTNAQYAIFVEKTGHDPAAFVEDVEFNQPQQPVTGVQYGDAVGYCAWAGKRLPTEIEWEKAARGTKGQLYPWGQEMDGKKAHLVGTAPVSIERFENDKSPYGVRAMAGNVSEWVSDLRAAHGGVCRDNDITPRRATLEMRALLAQLKAANGGVLPELCATPTAIDQTTPSEPCAYIKGNNWDGRPHMTVSSNRMWDYTNSYAEFVGFRCAKDI